MFQQEEMSYEKNGAAYGYAGATRFEEASLTAVQDRNSLWKPLVRLPQPFDIWRWPLFR